MSMCRLRLSPRLRCRSAAKSGWQESCRLHPDIGSALELRWRILTPRLRAGCTNAALAMRACRIGDVAARPSEIRSIPASINLPEA